MHPRVKPGDSGEHVELLQREVNRTLGYARVPWLKCEVTGMADEDTFRAAGFAAAYKGLRDEQVWMIYTTDGMFGDGEISRHAYAILTGQKDPNPSMEERAAERREYFVKLRKEHEDG